MQRTFLGYDVDLRPGAVGAAFTSGAQFYLSLTIRVAQNLTLLRSLESQFPDRGDIPEDIRLMWRDNERLRKVAIESGLEQETLRTLLEPEISFDESSRQIGRRGVDGPKLGKPGRGLIR